MRNTRFAAIGSYLASPRGQFSVAVFRAFSLAALTSLSIWHGYQFRTEYRTTQSAELMLVDATTTVTVTGKPHQANSNK
jgi:hypothetical protein